MILYESLLSGMDKVMEQGDSITDPFNVLDVIDIFMENTFIDVLRHLDVNKLYDKTRDFKYHEWEDYMRCKYFLVLSLELQEILAKFTWWLCHQVLYEQRDSKIIDLSEIISNKSLYNSGRLYIYTSNVVVYTLSISIDTAGALQVRFKNKLN
jgi:hypothetical protein